MTSLRKLVLLIAAGSSAACSGETDPGPLRIGALYQAFENGSDTQIPADNYYLRFVDERTVLNTVSDDPPEEIRTWLREGAGAMVNSERYTLDGNTVVITYNLTSEYRGLIDGDEIFFTVTVPGGNPAQFERNYRRLD